MRIQALEPEQQEDIQKWAQRFRMTLGEYVWQNHLLCKVEAERLYGNVQVLDQKSLDLGEVLDAAIVRAREPDEDCDVEMF